MAKLRLQTGRVLEVATRIEQSILAQRLAPGDLLPPERRLAEELGVSRSVVREALKRLQSVGLVVCRQGSGTRVAAPGGDHLQTGFELLIRHGACSLRDLAAVRLPLETAIASLAAENRTQEHLDELAASQRLLGDGARPLKLLVEADVRFHAVLAEATGNPIFAIVLSPIQKLLVQSRRRTLHRFGAKVAYLHHEQILSAVLTRDPLAASQAMRLHLEANLQHAAEMDEDPTEIEPDLPDEGGSPSASQKKG